MIHQITVLGTFQIASRLGDRYVFMWQPLKMLSIFNILTWKKTKNEKLFQKTGVLLFRWNYWDRKCKISMQNCSVRSHVKTNRMGSTKWTYQTLQVTTSFFFFFWKFCFGIRISNKELIRPTTQTSIFILLVSVGILFEWAFSLWVSLKRNLTSKKNWKGNQVVV